jgi:MFS family permease
MYSCMNPRHRTALLGGLLVSELGSAATDVVVAWLVLTHTGSATLTGLVWASSSLAMLLGGPFGGYVADALPRRRAMIGADIGRTVLVACLGAALLSGWFWLPAVLAVVFANALLSLTFEGALQALVPAMAGEALEQFNSRLQAARLGGALAGPALGGVLLAATSRPALALLIDAATYLISVAAVSWIRVQEPARLLQSGTRALLGGVAAIRAHPELRRLTTLAVSMAALFPVFMLALPLIARSSGTGGAGYGALSSLFVLGMAAGGFTAAPLAARLGPDRTIAAGLLVAAAATLVLAWSPVYAVSLAAATAIGLAVGPIDIVFFSSFQRACPPQALGRATTQLLSLTSLVRAPAFALAGAAFAALGTPAMLIACAVAEIGGGLVYVLTAASTASTLVSSAPRS